MEQNKRQYRNEVAPSAEFKGLMKSNLLQVMFSFPSPPSVLSTTTVALLITLINDFLAPLSVHSARKEKALAETTLSKPHEIF